MSLYKSTKSPFYQYDFQINGRRFLGSTKAKNRKDAEAIEHQLKAKAREDLKHEKQTGSGPMTLDIAAGRYWIEVGEHHKNSAATWHQLKMLLDFYGNDKRLDAITDADVATLVAHRRKQTRHGRKKDKAGKPVPTVSNSTVNRTALVPLKAIFTRAKKTWKQQLPAEPNWRGHWLTMPEERVRELDSDEAQKLDATVRQDYAHWFEYARITGSRRNETLIRWSNVNWFAKRIVTIGKRGKNVTAHITPEIKAILEACKGHHNEFVFTYVCQRTWGDKLKGKRYPITPEGAKTEWRRHRKRSGVSDFRFHDIRHDVATKLLRETGNMKLVQRALNHSNICRSP